MAHLAFDSERQKSRDAAIPGDLGGFTAFFDARRARLATRLRKLLNVSGPAVSTP
jgi:hypothetical protein